MHPAVHSKLSNGSTPSYSIKSNQSIKSIHIFNVTGSSAGQVTGLQRPIHHGNSSCQPILYMDQKDARVSHTSSGWWFMWKISILQSQNWRTKMYQMFETTFSPKNKVGSSILGNLGELPLSLHLCPACRCFWGFAINAMSLQLWGKEKVASLGVHLDYFSPRFVWCLYEFWEFQLINGTWCALCCSTFKYELKLEITFERKRHQKRARKCKVSYACSKLRKRPDKQTWKKYTNKSDARSNMIRCNQIQRTTEV